MRRIFSAFCAENAAGTAAYLIKEFNQIIVLDVNAEGLSGDLGREGELDRSRPDGEHQPPGVAAADRIRGTMEGRGPVVMDDEVAFCDVKVAC